MEVKLVEKHTLSSLELLRFEKCSSKRSRNKALTDAKRSLLKPYLSPVLDTMQTSR